MPRSGRGERVVPLLLKSIRVLICRNKTILRRSIWYKCCRKARRISKKIKTSVYEIRQMLSYLGWIKASDVYHAYLIYIKPFIDFHNFKKIIGRSERRKKNEMGIAHRITVIQAA